MSPSDIEEVLEMQPFKPLQFTLSSGDRFVITNRLRVAVNEGGGMVVWLPDPDRTTGRHLKLISTVNIAMIERLESGAPENGIH